MDVDMETSSGPSFDRAAAATNKGSSKTNVMAWQFLCTCFRCFCARVRAGVSWYIATKTWNTSTSAINNNNFTLPTPPDAHPTGGPATPRLCPGTTGYSGRPSPRKKSKNPVWSQFRKACDRCTDKKVGHDSLRSVVCFLLVVRSGQCHCRRRR